MSLFYQEAAVQKPVVFTGLKPGQEAVKVAKRGPLCPSGLCYDRAEKGLEITSDHSSQS